MRILEFAKAVSDNNRNRIVNLLIKGPLKVTEIADKLEIEENLASHHLRYLQTQKFLKRTKRGREVIYQINKTKFTSLFKEILRNNLYKEILKELQK
jgi:DNA-binding transcriptional ArsR family regulator